ncbi:hypothetical protein GGI05_005014 [Coemansia sp. RSA 2603]|nr:hypothetical protein GGI05_005014 [Coemansia sp. RSA 2603]
MDTSVQELRSICDMLTENLISLNIEEDPSTNSVVQDMCGEIKRRKASVFNFINILGSESEVMMMKLTDVVDRADKCIWLYDKTLSAHEEWKAIQESLKTSAAEEARMNALEGTVRSIGSTRSFANLSGELHAESSKATAMLLAAAGSPAHMASSAATAAGVSSLSNVISEPLKSASVEVSDYTPGNSGSPVSYTTAAGSRAPLSSKARGKMAEDPSNPVTNSDDWDYHRDDSAYGGSTESAKLDTHYH